ncbi:hypothetical protein ACS0TY_015070 [Phlomoides rotata]
MMLASLRNENKILLCRGPFNSEQERFIQHFELLQKACLPDHASYYTFRETVAHARFSLLLVQDGKLYGREPMFAVICKAALLPDGAKNHDIQKNKTVAQIGQLELAFRKEFGDTASSSIEQNLCLKICKHILIWVEEQTYWIALRFLVLGFELELYSTSEYCMVYCDGPLDQVYNRRRKRKESRQESRESKDSGTNVGNIQVEE